MADITIIGLDDFLKDLEELPKAIQKKLVARALREASAPIRERMAETAPDDPTTPGSQIRENIGINVTEQTADHALAYIGPTRQGFVGGFAELGTAHQTATPFIGPAFDEMVDDAVKIIAEVLGEGIEKEMKKR